MIFLNLRSDNVTEYTLSSFVSPIVIALICWSGGTLCWIRFPDDADQHCSNQGCRTKGDERDLISIPVDQSTCSPACEARADVAQGINAAGRAGRAPFPAEILSRMADHRTQAKAERRERIDATGL